MVHRETNAQKFKKKDNKEKYSCQKVALLKIAVEVYFPFMLIIYWAESMNSKLYISGYRL